MKILGIDPGTTSIGYGVIESEKNALQVVDFGCINASPKTFNNVRIKTEPFNYLPLQLKKIYDEVTNLIERHHPKELACEKLFMYKNVKTAMSVGQSRGVIILAGVNSGIEVCEYTPLQVKQSVVGYGKATKNQVQQMVKTLLNMKEIPRPDDAADALAIAICHINSAGFGRLVAYYNNP